MDTLINRYATPLTTGLFAVSTISGVALFFHWQAGLFHSMHTWLSMLLLLPFALHVWKNWRPLVGYARRGVLILPLLACVLVAAPFAITGLSAGPGGNPAIRTVSVMTRAPLDDLAPVLKTTPEELRATLTRQGYTVPAGEGSLETVAASAGKTASELLFTLLPAPPAR